MTTIHNPQRDGETTTTTTEPGTPEPATGRTPCTVEPDVFGDLMRCGYTDPCSADGVTTYYLAGPCYSLTEPTGSWCATWPVDPATHALCAGIVAVDEPPVPTTTAHVGQSLPATGSTPVAALSMGLAAVALGLAAIAASRRDRRRGRR